MKRWIWLLILSGATLLSACNPLDNKTKAGLQVITGDYPASLFLNDQYLEKTPYISKGIKPGRYTLKIQPDDQNLVAYETPLELRQGMLTVVTWNPGSKPELSGGVIYEMEKLKGTKKGELSIVTIPDGGVVSIQEQTKVFAPVTLTDLDPGGRDFEVSLPSYNTQQHKVNVVGGHKVTITVKLAKTDEAPTSAAKPSSSPEPNASPSPSPVSGTSSRQASISAQQVTNASPSGSPQETGAQVKINNTNFFQNGKEVLRVRDAANNTGAELGFASVGSQYPYLGQTTNGWHQINFEGKTGWVSGQLTTLIEE